MYITSKQRICPFHCCQLITEEIMTVFCLCILTLKDVLHTFCYTAGKAGLTAEAEAVLVVLSLLEHLWFSLLTYESYKDNKNRRRIYCHNAGLYKKNKQTLRPDGGSICSFSRAATVDQPNRNSLDPPMKHNSTKKLSRTDM